MGFRVDKVRVTITVYVDFGGTRDIAFEFGPERRFDHDLDPLVAALLEKHRQLVRAEMLAAGPADPTVFL